jgi:hypothetical protein
MTDLIRSAALTHYPEIARSVGLDPNQMMRKVRLPLACFERPEVRIAVTGFRRLLETSATSSGAQDFGLRMAEYGGLTNLGPVALVVREQETVGGAIDALARYIHIHHEGMRLDVQRRGQTVTIALSLRGRHPSASNQSIDLGLGTVHRVIQSLIGDKWRPLEVHFRYPPPRDQSRHRKFFGCPLVFNAEMDAVVISAEDMKRRIPSAHPLMANYLRKRVEAIDTRPAGWDEKVDEVVRALLATAIARSSASPSILRATAAPSTVISQTAAPASRRSSTPSAPSSSPSSSRIPAGRCRRSPSSSASPRKAPWPAGSAAISAARSATGARACGRCGRAWTPIPKSTGRPRGLKPRGPCRGSGRPRA